MHTPGHTAAQRVMHTSDAFFRSFINVWLVYALALTGYTALWEPDSLYAAVVCVACGVVAKLVLRQGHTILVRWMFIPPFFVMLMAAPWLVNGIRTPLLVHMILLLIFTGWMLGTRVLWVFATSFSVNVTAMWYAERRGWWILPQPLRESDMWLISWQFSIVLSAIVMAVLIRNYRVDIQRETTWQHRLQQALQFNALVIDSSPVPIRVFGPQGQCVAVNDAYARLMGQPRENLLAQNLHHHAMHSDALSTQCLQVLKSGHDAQCELEVATSDHRTLWLGVHLVPFERDGQRYLLAHLIDRTAQRQATQELQQLAFHDSLTGLANRRLLWEHFQQAQHLSNRQQQWGAILLLDLNHFKALNDLHGHAAGDEMLQEVARRLQLSVRASDVIARLGGDEFALLLQGVGKHEAQAQEHVLQLCHKLQEVLAQPYHLGPITHRASASIGMALIGPHGHANLDTLLREADHRMYTHKKNAAADARNLCL